MPRSMVEAFDKEFGVEVRQGWGMTEMSPIGSINVLKPEQRAAPETERYDIQIRQGRAVYGVEMKIVDTEGNTLPCDGEAFGELKVRGPWVSNGYYRDEECEAVDSEGWFATGDVATIDSDGYMEITDRMKDLIKSGGEWISSIELENLAMSHPDVMQAAVIGIPDEKWTERPLLIVKPKSGGSRRRTTGPWALWDAASSTSERRSWGPASPKSGSSPSWAPSRSSLPRTFRWSPPESA